jgi:hypothetical protein
MTEVPFNPNVKDGRGIRGLSNRKSNWANTIEQPPFEAYGVTCGLTFTFGGLKIDTSARVIDTDGVPIPGLFAAGELVGGIFLFQLSERHWPDEWGRLRPDRWHDGWAAIRADPLRPKATLDR